MDSVVPAAPVDLVPVAQVDLDRGVAVAADRAGLLMVVPGMAARRAMVRRIAAGVARLDREARIPHATAAPADLRPTGADRPTAIARVVSGATPMDLRVIEPIAAVTVDPADSVVRAVASGAGVAPVDLVVAAVRWAKSFRPRSSTN